MTEVLNPEYEVDGAIQCGEIIGGAWDGRLQRIVPVDLVHIFRNDDEGYDLYEFRNEAGEALAMSATVDPGRRSRCWRLTYAAREAGYVEVEVPYDGTGEVHVWRSEGKHGVYFSPDQNDGMQQRVTIEPGDAIMFVSTEAAAKAGEAKTLGFRVLSFVTRPFDLSFEEVIDPPLPIPDR